MGKRPTEDDLKRMGLTMGPDGVYSKGVQQRMPENRQKSTSILPYPNGMWEDKSKQVEVNLTVSKPVAVFEIIPIGAPRMSQSDKWKTDPFHQDEKRRQRKSVTQYFKFKKDLTSLAEHIGYKLPDHGFHVVFIIPMPHSWSEKKKRQMSGAPHQQKPDVDNCTKAVWDTLRPGDDAKVWDCRITKYWGSYGKIIIYNL